MHYPSGKLCWYPVFSTDGRWFAMANRFEHIVQVFDTANGSEEMRIVPDIDIKTPLGPCNPNFSPDGKSLAVDVLGTVRLFDLSSRTWLKQRWLKSHYGGSMEPSFSPDGRILAIEVYHGVYGDGLGVELFDVDTEKEILSVLSGLRIGRILRTEPLYEFKYTFSPDSRLFAVGAAAGDPVQLFEAKTGERLARMELGWGFKGVLFSPDGRTLAAASNNGSVRLLDVESLSEIGRGQHAKAVTHMEFSPDSRFLVTASEDGTALMMAVKSMGKLEAGKEIARFEHGAPLTQANFSHDGRSLLTVSDDQVKLWPADPEWPFEQLCARSGHNLSREEWRTLIGETEAWQVTCPIWHTPGETAPVANSPKVTAEMPIRP